MSYDNFPEVYHAHGITTPPFTGAERPVTGQGANTIYRRKISLWRSTYCVFRPLRAGAGKKIRNWYFSDLRSGEEELLQHGHKKRVIVAMSGLLHHEQI